MPLSEAGSTEDAQTRLLSQVNDSIAAALDEAGASYYKTFKEQDRMWFMDDLCRVRAQIHELYKATSPAYIAGTQEQR